MHCLSTSPIPHILVVLCALATVSRRYSELTAGDDLTPHRICLLVSVLFLPHIEDELLVNLAATTKSKSNPVDKGIPGARRPYLQRREAREEKSAQDMLQVLVSAIPP